MLQNTTLRHQNALLSHLTGEGVGAPIRPLRNTPCYISGATERGLQWPARTGPVSAFQELSSANNLPAGSIVTTDVLGFFPWITCEIAYIIRHLLVRRSRQHFSQKTALEHRRHMRFLVRPRTRFYAFTNFRRYEDDLLLNS